MEGISKNHTGVSFYCYSAAAMLLSFAILATNFELGLAARINSSGKTTTEFIKTSCKTTSYQALCVSSLAEYASTIQTSPTEIAHAALSVSLNGAKSISAMMSNLSTGAGLKPIEVAGMKDCIENVEDSVEEIKQSIGEMCELKGRGFGLHINNMQTWVSAALTDEDTCMEGFAGAAMNAKLKDTVRAEIVELSHLTSNGLALVNALASTQPALP